jgi:hypothetical protein
MLLDLRQTTFLKGSQASTICSAGKRTVLMKVNVEHWWDDTGKGNIDFKMKIKPNYIYRFRSYGAVNIPSRF